VEGSTAVGATAREPPAQGEFPHVRTLSASGPGHGFRQIRSSTVTVGDTLCESSPGRVWRVGSPAVTRLVAVP
jgi:hypothetical protein